MDAKRSGWGVTAAGAILALGGAYGIWSGWDQIQLERGWSQFIAGATALSGGVVTVALGRVVAALTRLAARPDAPAPVAPVRPPRPVRPPEPPPQAQPHFEAPIEVDRYASGDATYVMFSDGSVEVQTYEGSQRFSSLAALREEASRDR